MRKDAIISSEKETIKSADYLILPGVGAFDHGIRNIDILGLREVLIEKVIHKNTPILGICLGMQLLTKSSEEGSLSGLSFINAETVKFDFMNDEINQNLKIPHMGWNNIEIKKYSTLFTDVNNDYRFYFAHSYHIICRDCTDILSTTKYGYDFVSSIQKDNIFGVQFHPEKSHKFGFKLLYNFLNLT